MAFAEIELARVEKAVGSFCSRRIPPEIHDKLKLEYVVKRHDVTIYEVRPHWKLPGEKLDTPVAKIKYIRSKNEWRLYWMRRDLKWHSYEPHPVGSLEALVEVIDQDSFCCFFG